MVRDPYIFFEQKLYYYLHIAETLHEKHIAEKRDLREAIRRIIT